jgi:hypothetical protein
MEDFSDFLCVVCGEAIGREPYFAAFGGRQKRMGPELWPEQVFHRRCMTAYIDATRGPGDTK